MSEETLYQMFDDVFENLGITALYQGEIPVECLVLIKEPEQLYELGDGQFVERIASFEIKTKDVSNPKVGHILHIKGRKYKVHQEPLLDSSGTVYEIEAIRIGLENK